MKSNKKIIGIILLLFVLLGVNSCFFKESFANAYGSRIYCGIKNIKGQTQDSWANNVAQGEGKSITENGVTYYWSLSEFLKNGGNDGTAELTKGWVEKELYKKTEVYVSNGIVSAEIDGEKVRCTLSGKIISETNNQNDEIDIDKILIYQRGYLGVQFRHIGELEYREFENWKDDITQGNGKKVLEDGVTYYFSSSEFLAQSQLGSSRVRGWIIYNEKSYQESTKLDSTVVKTDDGYTRVVDKTMIYYDKDFNPTGEILQDETESSKLKSVASVEAVEEKSINFSYDAYVLYIKDLYPRALKRDCTEEELQTSLDKSIYNTTIDIILSEEANEKNQMDTNKEFVIVCYNCILNTSGEESGISSNEAWLNAGNTRENLIRKFINSDEFSKIKIVPNYEKMAKINKENRELRARAEQEIARMDNPADKQKAIEEAERLERLSKINLIQDDVLREYLETVLQEIYQRDANDNEIDEFINIHKDGYDIEEILYRIIDTDECVDFINSLSDEDFVNKAYVLLTYQVPNQYKRNTALEDLKNMDKTEWLINKLLRSPEFSTLKYKLVKNNFNFEVIKQDEYNPQISTDKKGDINGDDVVDARDASMLLTIVSDIAVSEEEKYLDYKEALDIDGSDTVTTQDAVVLLKYYAVASTGFDGSLEEYLNSDLFKNSELYNSNE